MPKQPSLRDIAKHANVALSTVSQVLNNKAGVTPETRQQVLKAAADLGYRQKITLDSAVSTQLKTIGLLTKRYRTDQMMINPFYSYVLAGAERECQRHNISLMYANIEVDEQSKALSYPSMLLDQRVDGVIVVGAFFEETILRISQHVGQNIVLVDAYTSGELSFDSVLIDNAGGATQAVNHLIEQGHHKIGLIGTSSDAYPSISERRAGYLAALKSHGIETAYVEEGYLNRASAMECTLRLLRRSPEISAIFAANDECAFGVMDAARVLNLEIPVELSVVGFDDIDLAQEVSPPLTTVHVDKVFMGVMALRHLRQRVEAPDSPGMKTMISTQLITRDSVRTIS